MKSIVMLLTAVGLLSTACSPPPSKPRSAQIAKPEVPIVPKDLDGKPVEVKDSYLGLQCNVDEPKGFRAWRRLSNVELKNTITSVFGVKDVDVSSLPDDITRLGVYDTMMIPINYVDSQRYRAARLVAKAVAAKADLNALFPCLKEGATCVSKTLATLGSLAYRRPMAADEVTALTSLFTATATDLGNDEAARFLIQALILSQPFLYRSELGVKGDDDVYTLTDWELASALSYSILRGPPDEELRKLADSKGLSKGEELEKQVNRLLADPKSKESLKDFANMWLDSRSVLKTDRPAIKDYTADVKQKSMNEVGDLFSEVLARSEASTLESLLTADKIPTSSGFVYDAMIADGHVQFKEPERRGILGQASFLASTSAVDYTSPVQRGAFVIERMLCTGFGPFPTVPLPEKKEGQTNRQRYRDLEKATGCNNCHTPMNAFGFVFENFDSIGKFRTTVEGEMIEVNSEVNIDGKTIVVTSPAELSEAIAGSEQGKECYSRHILRYGFGRPEYAPLPVIGAKKGSTVMVTSQGEADACHIKAMTEAMTEADGDLMAPLVKLLTSDAFRKRIDRKAEETGVH